MEEKNATEPVAPNAGSNAQMPVASPTRQIVHPMQQATNPLSQGLGVENLTSSSGVVLPPTLPKKM